MVSRDRAFIIIVIIYFQAKSVLEKNRKDGSIICSLASDCQYAQRPTKSFRDLEVSLCIAIKCIFNDNILSWLQCPAADLMMIKCHRIEKPCKSPAVLPTCFPSLSAGRRAWCWCARRRSTPPPPRSSTSTASRSASKAPRYLFPYSSLYLQEDVHTLAQTPRISIDDTDSNPANSHTSLPNPGYNR